LRFGSSADPQHVGSLRGARLNHTLMAMAT
jgi:hypothetical protein